MRIFEIPQFAVASAASSGAAIGAHVWAPIFAAMPSLGALLAAFAGAGLILSFLPPRPDTSLRMAGTIVFCTLLGWLFAPYLAGRLTDAPHSIVELPCAFAAAAILQALIPLFVDHRAQIVARLVSLIPGTGGSK